MTRRFPKIVKTQRHHRVICITTSPIDEVGPFQSAMLSVCIDDICVVENSISSLGSIVVQLTVSACSTVVLSQALT